MKIAVLLSFTFLFSITFIKSKEIINETINELLSISRNKTSLSLTLQHIESLLENKIIEKTQAIQIWSLIYENFEKEENLPISDLEKEEPSKFENNENTNNPGSYQILIILLIGGAIVTLILLSIISNLYGNQYIWSLILFLSFCSYNVIVLSKTLIHQLELNFLASLAMNISFFMIMTIIYLLLLKMGLKKRDEGILEAGKGNIIFSIVGLIISYLFCFSSSYPFAQIPFFGFLFLNCYLAGVKCENCFKIIQPSYIIFVIILSCLLILNFLFFGNEIFILPLKSIDIGVIRYLSRLIVDETIINFVDFKFFGNLSSVIFLNCLPILFVLFKFSDKITFNYDETLSEFKEILMANDLKIEFKNVRIALVGLIVHALLFLCLKIRLFIGFAISFIYIVIFNSILLKSDVIWINLISFVSGFFMLNGVFLIDKYEDQFSNKVVK